eukprot:TRINITY_DN5936_c0_g2_i1.p2 TRINITY_DN5936_c0_g2~~TRINITY_DN5936_c0_g2_i1.p2  ORF type:complete len:124 (+),score=21.78 TRINITY_DN5936_c0_g2_i1:1012-1383(+)
MHDCMWASKPQAASLIRLKVGTPKERLLMSDLIAVFIDKQKNLRHYNKRRFEQLFREDIRKFGRNNAINMGQEDHYLAIFFSQFPQCDISGEGDDNLLRPFHARLWGRLRPEEDGSESDQKKD